MDLEVYMALGLLVFGLWAIWDCMCAYKAYKHEKEQIALKRQKQAGRELDFRLGE